MNGHEISNQPQPYELSQQLHGKAYEAAQAELEFLDQISNELHTTIVIFSATHAVATTGEPLVYELRHTPEGDAVVEPDYLTVPVDEIPIIYERQVALVALLEQVQVKANNISARLWQETGTNLFKEWEAGQVDPEQALDSYFTLWNTYTPDDFYEHCDTTKEQVVQLFNNSLADYALKSAAANRPDNEIIRTFMRKIALPAASLGIDVRDFGLNF